MLKDHFYTISNLKVQGTKATVQLSFNPKHPIYDGHFPDHPVTPGVCQLQILKDVVTEILRKPYYLSSAKTIKFLNVLTPQQDNVKLELEYSESKPGLEVKALLSAGDKVFFKFSGKFQTGLRPSS